MKQDFRKSMAWLHTYSGLLIGWLLFAIWVTGTLSYFNYEISLWMKPELQYSQNRNELINESLVQLYKQGQHADRWRIHLPNNRHSHWRIEWREGRVSQTLTLNPENTKQLQPRDTQGGNFFRTFHYTLELRGYGGRFFAGIAAMTFLVALFSGIFTHRRFFKDFFTLRKVKQTIFLRDFHALVGVITLPFNIMICVSALFIYVIMYMPWSAESYYEGGERALYRDVIPSLPRLDSAAAAEPMLDFSSIQRQIDRAWPGQQQVARITIESPFKQNGRMIVERVKDASVSRQAERLVFSSRAGVMQNGYDAESTPAQIRRVLWGLHEAKFAPSVLRWLFFFLGVISSALIATGLIYWLQIRPEPKHFGHSLVERLNIAGIAGLFIAIASYFVANRMLPLEVPNRGALEVNVFLWVWLCSLIAACLRPVQAAWVEQLSLAAFAFFSVLCFDLFQDAGRMVRAFEQGNWAYISMAMAFMILTVVFVSLAIWLSKATKSNQKNRVQTLNLGGLE